MILPLRRDRLKERSEIDVLEELKAAREESPAERLELAIELSELTRTYLAPLHAAARYR